MICVLLFYSLLVFFSLLNDLSHFWCSFLFLHLLYSHVSWVGLKFFFWLFVVVVQNIRFMPQIYDKKKFSLQFIFFSLFDYFHYKTVKMTINLKHWFQISVISIKKFTIFFIYSYIQLKSHMRSSQFSLKSLSNTGRIWTFKTLI